MLSERVTAHVAIQAPTTEHAVQRRRLQIWNLPNALTASRLVLAPLTLTAQQLAAGGGAPWHPTPGWLYLALLGLVIAEYSDYYDGKIARRMGEVSDFGKLLDPLCDSIFRMFVFMGFVASGWMPVWMLAIHFLRDILVAYLRVIAGLYEVVLAARISGKVKAVVQATAQIAFVCFFLFNDAGLPQWLLGAEIPMRWAAWVLMGISTAVTAWSAWDYGRHVMRGIADVKAG
jgi:CDP-diacylglycerol--glycerol-3-phosphate 3-phosphatidyltransferase